MTAAAVAGPGIGLAALALCAGFLAFLPTDYRGLSELGIIASAGMLIGVVISLTTLPAWLASPGRRRSSSRSAMPRWRRSTAS